MILSAECVDLTRQSDPQELLARLQTVELRRGTGAEQPGDLDCAQAIVHRFNNVITAVRLRQELQKLQDQPPTGG